MEILFHEVLTSAAKLEWIVAVIHYHFEEKQRVLIAVPNEEAATFIDLLLWRVPAESFIPHSICHKPCQDAIAISTQMVNFNKAQVLINLCPKACPISNQFEYILELNDKTHPTKAELSQLRMAEYQSAGHSIKGASKH